MDRYGRCLLTEGEKRATRLIESMEKKEALKVQLNRSLKQKSFCLKYFKSVTGKMTPTAIVRQR